MLNPWNGLRCCPLIAPSTSRRDRNPRSAILAMTSGSEYVRDGGMGGSFPDRDICQEFLHDRVARGVDSVSVVVDDHAVAEHGPGNGADVVDRDAGPAVERGAGLRCQYQGLSGTWSGPPRDPIADVFRSAMRWPARGPDQSHRVINALVRDRHAPHQVLQGADPVARYQGADLLLVRPGGESVDPPLFVGSRITDKDFEEE